MKKEKKHNTLKTKLALSYILLTAMVGCTISIVHYFNIFSLTEKQTFFSIKTIENLSRANSTLHMKYLSPFAKQFVILKAETTADDIAEIIDAAQKSDQDNIFKNPEIRRLATQDIMIDNQVVGNMILINKEKDIILSSNGQIEGKNYKDIKHRYPQLYKLVDEGVNKYEFEGYYDINTNKKKEGRRYLAAVKVPNASLYIIAAVYVGAYMNPIFNKLHRQEDREISSLLSDLNNFFSSSLRVLLLISAITLGSIILISLFISNILAQTIAKPIIKLKTAVEKLGKGNFETHVKEEGTNETIQLARTFNNLGKDIKSYIEELKIEISQRKQIESEINIARKIQQSQLPGISNEFKRKEFNLHADLLPAKNVAGDFYDFFYLDKDKNKLVFLIGDVSGKGVPAAFFMGVSKTILKHAALSNKLMSPGELLTEVNNILFVDNTEAMFVSLFLIYYDIETSELLYSNAGHHPALKITKDGSIEEFGKNKDPLLGIFDNNKFSTFSEKLHARESIVLFTDGITEAFSENKKELFESKNLFKILEENSSKLPKEICKTVFNSVIKFQDNILFDDITMIILKKNN
jgi:serine phosphatase RsbU (regulator of sigma subunit)